MPPTPPKQGAPTQAPAQTQTHSPRPTTGSTTPAPRGVTGRFQQSLQAGQTLQRAVQPPKVQPHTGALPPPGFSELPNDPQQLPNYEKLTGTERFVMRSLAGLPLPVTQALERFSNSWAGKALGALDVGAEAVERTAGFAAQALQAAGTPEWGEFTRNITSAWYAGSLAADMANMTLTYDPQTGRYTVPQDLPGIAGVVQARQQISELTAQGMSQRDALSQARDTYYTSQGSLAIRAQMNDAFVHIAGDPLNVLLPMLKPVERLHAARAAIVGTKTNDLIIGERVADITRLTSELADAEKLQDAARVTELTEKLAAARYSEQAARASKASPWQEMILRITGGDPTKPVSGFWASRWNPLALTPQSRAMEFVNNTTNHITDYVFNAARDPEDVVKIIQRGADGMTAPGLGHMVVSYEGRQVMGTYRAITAHANDMLDAWRRTGAVERPALQLIAEALGETPAKIIKRLADGEDAAVLTRLSETMRASQGMAAKLQALSQATGLTPDALLARLKSVFQYSDDPLKMVPFGEDIFKLQLSMKISDVAAQQGILNFGVKYQGMLQHASQAMKAAETLAFLRMNPAYPVRNWINNTFTMLARGAFGTMSDAGINNFWRRMGYEPARLRQAVSMAELPQLIAKGGEGSQAAATALAHAQGTIAQVVRGEKNWLTNIEDFFKNINLGPVDTGKWAQAIEQQASARAFTTYYVKGLKQYYRAGNGILEKIGDFDPNLERLIGRDRAAAVQHAIADAWTPDELRALSGADNLNLNTSAIAERVRQQTGMADIEHTLGADFFDGIRDDLMSAAKGGTLDSFKEQLGVKVQAHLDDALDKQLDVLTQEARARISLEGPQGYVKLNADIMDEFWGAQEQHAMDVARITEQIRGVQDATIAEGLWRQLSGEGETFFGRMWKRMEARMTGFSDAAKELKLPHANTALTSTQQWRKSWEKFFSFRNKAINDFFEAARNKATQPGQWEALVQQLDARYAEAVAGEAKYTGALDDALTSMLPPPQQHMFRAWRETVASARAEDKALVVAFRERIKTLPRSQWDAAYKQHWQQRQQIWNQIRQYEQAGTVAMQGNPEAANYISQSATGPMMGRLRRTASEQGIPTATEAGKPFDNAMMASLNKRLPEGGQAFTPEELRAGLSSERSQLAEDLLKQRAVEKGLTPAEQAAQTFEQPLRTTFLPDADELIPRMEPQATGFDQLWYTRGRHVTDSIIDATKQIASEAPTKWADLPAEAQTALKAYMAHAEGALADARHAATKLGEFGRDSALLNYSRRFNYNSWLGVLAPYEFWATQSVWKWALHSLDRPAMLTTYLRYKQFVDTAYRPSEGLPSRLRGHLRIPLPFMPQWFKDFAGDEVFIDPMRTALPFEGFASPLEMAEREKFTEIGGAKRKLEEMLNDGKISEWDYNQALQSQSGPIWNDALTQVRMDDSEGRLNPLDFALQFISPHLPLMYAFNKAGVTQQEPGMTPIGRSIGMVQNALGIDPAGGLNVEAAIRKQLGYMPFTQWDDYRAERSLANMAALGEISVTDAQRAMIDHNGPAWELAKKRSYDEYFLQTGTSLFLGVPVKAYPPGEEHLRELSNEYAATVEAYQDGDIDAYKKFFDAHPEYEARLMLFKDPEQRMRAFLVDQFWNTYNELPDLTRQRVVEQLGPEFEQLMLNKDTRSYGSIPAEKLGLWLKLIGGDPPGSLSMPEGGPLALDLPDPDVAKRAQAFYDLREQQWNWDEMRDLQSMYFRLDEEKNITVPVNQPPFVRDYYAQRDGQFPGVQEKLSFYDNLVSSAERRAYKKDNPDIKAYEDWRAWYRRQNDDFNKWIAADDTPKRTTKQISARQEFLAEHPEITQYWDWRNDYLLRNPDVSPYLSDKPPKYQSEEQYQQMVEAGPLNLSWQEWQGVLGSTQLSNIVLDYGDGEALPSVARAMLKDRAAQLAEQYGWEGTPEELAQKILESYYSEQQVTQGVAP